MSYKRFLAVILVFIILTMPFHSFASANSLTRGEVTDMLLSAADFYNPSVSRNDIIKGYEDGLLHEEKFVSRAEALVMLSRAFGEIPSPVGHNRRVSLTAENFKDIPAWAKDELSSLFDSGIVAGTSEGRFSPKKKVTKEQMELFIKRVYALYGTNCKDDFYAFVNKDILEKLEILQGNVTAGTLENLQIDANNEVDVIINSIVSRSNIEGTPEQKIADLYRSIIDTDSRNRAGIKPILKYLEKIKGVNNIAEFTDVCNLISEELCVNIFLDFSLVVDIEESTEYVLYLDTFRPLMNKEFYLESGTKKEAYIQYINTLLKLSGEKSEEALRTAEKYYEFEKELASSMLSSEQANDVKNIYNVTSYNKLSVMFPDFDIEVVLKNCGLDKDNKIIIKEKALINMLSGSYNQSNLDMLKTAAQIRLLTSCGETLSEDFNKAQQKFEKVILGKTEFYDSSQYAISVIKDVMPEYLGQMYAEKCIDEETRKDVSSITYDIIEVFKKRIRKLSWMSEETKEKAIVKLDKINVKIGAPENAVSYLDNASIVSPKRGGTYFDNMIAIKKEAIKHYGKMQHNRVEKDMWIIEPYTVNAAYNASSNDITLPVAILQPPFYDKNSTYLENLGGIGYIIAHEVSHAFDHTGAQFDENGNVSNWWTDEDYERFSLLCEDVVKFFDGEEAIPAVQNNGRLTLNENIADIAAAACVTELGKAHTDGNIKLLYEAMARSWAGTSTREYASYEAEADVHSNRKLRINRVLANIGDFYEAFDIKESDGMYVPPEERIIIW